MRKSLCTILAATLAIVPLSVSAFTSDDFNGATLGPQWTFGDSIPAGATYTMTGSHLSLTAPPDTDMWLHTESYGFIQQDAPVGSNWEIVVKIDNYDPTVPGQQRDFTRCGIQIWQDSDHHMTLSLLANNTGEQLGTNVFWQAKPNPGIPDGDASYHRVLDIFNFGPQPSYWIKLQKTSRGYQGFISSDNVNWLNFSPIVRISETADGFFTNEKIRLFDCGGFGAGSLTPVNFDSIEKIDIPAPPTVYQDDEFNGTALGSQWGFHPGIGVGSYLFDSGQLNIQAGIFANIWNDRDQGTYIYQDAPAYGSYKLTTKVGPTDLVADPNLGAPYELWNSFGLWLWRDNSTWAFISNQRGEYWPSQNPNNRIEYGYMSQGAFVTAAVDFNTGLLPAYLRLEKNGSTVGFAYSFDNTNWTTLPETANIGSNLHQIRLFTKRARNDGTPVDAKFDWLHAQDLTSGVGDWQLYR